MRLGDVLFARREDVEDEAAVRGEQPPHRGERRPPVVVGLHVQQRPERDQHQWERALDGRLAQISEPQVDEARHAAELELLLCDGKHPGRRVDADHPDARGGGRHRDPSRADAKLDDRPARAHRLLDVERDVLDDRARPRVVKARDCVVRGHGYSL